LFKSVKFVLFRTIFYTQGLPNVFKGLSCQVVFHVDYFLNSWCFLKFVCRIVVGLNSCSETAVHWMGFSPQKFYKQVYRSWIQLWTAVPSLAGDCIFFVKMKVRLLLFRIVRIEHVVLKTPCCVSARTASWYPRSYLEGTSLSAILCLLVVPRLILPFLAVIRVVWICIYSRVHSG